MDFSTINAAITIQQQDARRAIREREYDRRAEENGVVADKPTRQRRGFMLGSLFRSRVRSAQ